MPSAISQLGVSPRERAAKRFPHSAKLGLISGSGNFPASFRCNTYRWRIFLFPTAEARADAVRRHCGASRCHFDHTIEQDL
jgi:hypothetical protein